MQRGIGLAEVFWPQNYKIKIHFLDGTMQQHSDTIAYGSEWLPYVNLTFEFNVPLISADIRISFATPNVAWSHVGNTAQLSPSPDATMMLGFEEDGRVVRHEFGHMLGLLHEHVHPDTIVLEPDTIPDGYTPITNEYDLDSIMHYPFDSTMTSTGVAIPLPTVISPRDKEIMLAIYPPEEVLEEPCYKICLPLI